MPLVDVCGILYDSECWGAYLRLFADAAPRYLAVFASRLCTMTGFDPGSYQELLSAPHALVDALVATGRLDADVDGHAGRLRAQRVRMQVLIGGMGELRSGGCVNDRVASFAARHPDVMQAWAGLDMRCPDPAAELLRCVGDLGMSGGALSHFLSESTPLDAKSHAVYAAAERLGVPLWIHAGHNLSSAAPMDVCSWRDIDAVARCHPGLRIVIGHGGWPWVLEMIALAQRHPHVFLELSTHRASHMIPGSGWEPILAHGIATVRHKVLFGSMEWVHGLTPRALADEFTAAGLPPRAERMWLHDNAANLLRLEEATDGHA